MKRGHYHGKEWNSLSKRHLKRLITSSVEAAADASQSATTPAEQAGISPSKSVQNFDTNCSEDFHVEVKGTVVESTSSPICRAVDDEQVSSDDDCVSVNISVSPPASEESYVSVSAYVESASICSSSSEGAESQEAVNSVCSDTSNESHDEFLVLSDECDTCSLCVCLLACGSCEHHSPPALCSHCDKCNESAFVDDFDSSDDSNSGDVSLQDEVADWAVNGNISHTNLRSLLSILRRHHPEDNFPKTPRTPVKTARHIPVRLMSPGHYWHNGLTKNLVCRFADVDEQETIKLMFNMDGVPISTSSRSTLWPILCSVTGSDDVFVVGIYHGYGKPDSGNDYIQEMVQEVSDLCTKGLVIGDKHFPVSVHCFICDAPAKAMVLNVKNHNAYYGCCKCDQRGKMYGRRMSFTETEDFMERTNESFINELQPAHHKGKTLISLIPGVGPVTSFVLDPMHLLYLGVMKKLLMFWMFGQRSVKMGRKMCDLISSKLCSLQSFIPIEFVRKPRALEFVRRFKATEFRQILHYTGPLIFRHSSPQIYENFVALHVAVRILSSSNLCVEFNDYAKQLIKLFVDNFKIIYGEEYVSHNIHGILHISKEVLEYGPLDSYSAFKFENFLQKFKCYVRKGERPLQQIAKRYSEFEAAGERKRMTTAVTHTSKFLREHNEGPLVEGCGYPQYKTYRMENAMLNVDHEGDCCVGLTDGSVVVVKNFAYHSVSKQMQLIGMKYKHTEDLYTSPCPSSSLGVYKVHGSTSIRSWSIDKISHKLFRIPLKEKFAVLPLLHREKSKY